MSKGQPAGVVMFKDAATGGKDANSPRERELAMLAMLPKRERDKDLVRASVPPRRFQGCQGCQHCLPRGVASLVASLPRTTAFTGRRGPSNAEVSFRIWPSPCRSAPHNLRGCATPTALPPATGHFRPYQGTKARARRTVYPPNAIDITYVLACV